MLGHRGRGYREAYALVAAYARRTLSAVFGHGEGYLPSYTHG